MKDYRFLIDCGATSLMALNAGGIDSNLIDGIVISHFHGDHYGGLPFLLLDANYIKQRSRRLTIMGPPGVADRVGDLLKVMYPKVALRELSFELEFKEFSNSHKIEMGPLQVESFPVVHVPEAIPHGLRINGKDKTLSFSGDTGWTDSLYDISHTADLFICECNFYQTLSPSHLNYPTIMKQMENFDCKRIILNHLGVEMLKNIDQVELECSYDGLIVTI
jgi:ribonuclease BN (tRNA processing enzyme)